MRPMKPFHVVLLALVCLLAGCGRPAPAPAAQTPSPTAATAPAMTAPTAQGIVLGGKTFTGEETSLTLTLAPEELPQLDAFRHLTSLDLSGSTCYEDILRYQAAHPQVQVRYTVQLGDAAVPGDTAELTLPVLSNPADLVYLPHLRALTVESPLSPAQTAELKSLLPAAELRYALTFAGLTVNPIATDLDLSGIRTEDTAEALAALEQLPLVTTIRLSAPDGASPWTLEQAASLIRSRPQTLVKYAASAFGVSFDLSDEVVSFNGVDLSGRLEELRALLPALVHVGRLDMEGCNVPNEQMDALRNEFPAPKIVWRVNVKRYSCRTDAIMIRFSQCDDAMRLYAQDLQPLMYCRELRYVDLGHNYIANADFAAYLPELEVCILAVEKRLEDISGLANCPKLEYLEIFNGRVTDISPLANCKNLKHLNMSLNGISDISPLYGLNLERLWLASTRVPYTQIQDFQQRFPNCKVDFDSHRDPAATWRYKGSHMNPRYKLLRQQFCYDTLSINTYSAFNDPNRPQ